MLGSIISGGASLLGSAASIMNASKNREQQADFAKHGVQYRVADLRAAGLNPILAATNGSLQSTGIPQGSGVDTSGLSNAGTAFAQMKLNKAQNASTVALQAAQADNYIADTVNKNSSNELIKQQSMTEAARRGVMAAQVGDLNSSAALRYVDKQIRQATADFYNTSEGKQVAKGNEIMKHGKYGGALNAGLIAKDIFDKSSSNSNTNSARTIRAQQAQHNDYSLRGRD